MGYSDVHYYPGGLERWQQQGLMLEKGTSAPAVRALASNGIPLRRKRREFTIAFVEFVERTSTLQLFGLWFALILGCALLYWLASSFPGHGLTVFGQPMSHGRGTLATAIYFSFVTATSVGFGDVLPLGFSRALAVSEAAAALLVFSAVVSKFVSRRQEELVASIHRLTFEDRLSRLQTNMHLMVSEFQAISVLCSSPGAPPRRVQSRMSSAAMVFASELRAIHDLLYRPLEEPEEFALESILAALDAALAELAELLACSSGKVERPASLETNLRRIGNIAQEICGECVPKTYAPALRSMMDGIQERARLITGP